MTWDPVLEEAKPRELIQKAIDNGWRRADEPITLQILAEPGENADHDGYDAALESAGYTPGRSVDMDLRIQLTTAGCGRTHFNADAIWSAKAAVAEIALRHGFVPVGHELSSVTDA